MIVAGRGVEGETFLNTQIFSRYKLAVWFAHRRGDLISATYAQPEGRLSIFTQSVYPPQTPE